MRNTRDQGTPERLRRPVVRVPHSAVLEEAVDDPIALPAAAAGARWPNSNVISLSTWRRRRTLRPES